MALRLPGEAERPVKISSTTDIPGIAGTFAIMPLPVGVTAKGLVVVITKRDDTGHDLEF